MTVHKGAYIGLNPLYTWRELASLGIYMYMYSMHTCVDMYVEMHIHVENPFTVYIDIKREMVSLMGGYIYTHTFTCI